MYLWMCCCQRRFFANKSAGVKHVVIFDFSTAAASQNDSNLNSMAPKKRPACDALGSDGNIGREAREAELAHEIAHSVPIVMTFKGLNVKEHYARKLMEGSKTIEVRKYALGTRGTSTVMFIVATKQKDPEKTGAQVIGLTIFESFKEYTNDPVAFRNDFYRHLVPEGDGDFGFQAGRPLFGWIVKRSIPFTVPIPAKDLRKRTMIGWPQVIQLTPLLLPFWAGEYEDIMNEIDS